MNTPEFGTMHWRTALFLLATSILGCGLIFFKVIHGSYLVAAIPAIYAWARPSVYRLIADANYAALHRFEEDCIDREERNQVRIHNEVNCLDAEQMLRNLHINDEMAGRA